MTIKRLDHLSVVVNGLRSVMFAVQNLDGTIARLQTQGGELIGEVAQYEDQYRLCYMQGRQA